MFEGFFEFVSSILAWFFSITHSYGVSISLLTVLVMVITAPLTLKSTRSMVRMQYLQPQLRKIQKEYVDDKEEQQKQLMAFYQENDINPAGGCLPMLVQAPVFILLYRVIRGITHRRGGNFSGLGHITGQTLNGDSLTSWDRLEQPFRPDHLSSKTEMFETLEKTTRMDFFGVDLSITPMEALRLGVVTAIPFIILLVLMLLSSIYQQRQIQGRSSAQMNPQMQSMMKIMPFMLPIFSFSFPAGLSWYYLVQGICRIGLQSYITRAVFNDDHHAAMDKMREEAGEEDQKAPTFMEMIKGPQPTQSADSKSSAKKQPTSAKAQALQKKSEQQNSATTTPHSKDRPAGVSPRSTGRKSGEKR